MYITDNKNTQYKIDHQFHFDGAKVSAVLSEAALKMPLMNENNRLQRKKNMLGNEINIQNRNKTKSHPHT